MTYLRYLNYLIIMIFTSGISISCFNRGNKKQIEHFKKDLEKLYSENKILREKLNPPSELKESISDLDACLLNLLKNTLTTNMETIDKELRDEIEVLCNNIISSLPKDKLILEVDSNSDNSDNSDKTTIDSLSSSESYDKLIIELSKCKNDQ